MAKTRRKTPEVYDVTDLEIDEISLVDVPANPGARVTVYKRGNPAVAKKKTSEQTGPEAFLSSIRKMLTAVVPEMTDEQTEAVDAGMEEALAALNAEVAPVAKAGKKSAEKDDEDDEDDDPKDEDEAPRKKAKEPAAEKKSVEKRGARDDDADEGTLRGEIKKRQAIEKRLQDLQVKLELADREKRISVISKRLSAAGVADEDGELATTLDELPTEKATILEKRLVSQAEILKRSAIFEQYGSGGAAGGGAVGGAHDEMRTKVHKRMKETGEKSYEVAYADIYKTDVEMRRRLEAERN